MKLSHMWYHVFLTAFEERAVRVDQQTLAWSLIIVLLAMMPLLDTSEQANSVTNALMLAVGLFAGRTIQGPRLGGMA